MSQMCCIFAAVVLLAMTAVPVESTTNPDDFVIVGDKYTRGVLSARSVLVHTEEFDTEEYRWNGDNIISYIEIINLGDRKIGEMHISGGIASSSIYIIPSSLRPFSAMINIYATPHDETIGEYSMLETLVHSANVSGMAGLVPITYAYVDPAHGNVRRIDAIDLTSGIGSSLIVHFGEGANSNSVSIEFTSQLTRVPINYTINIFAEPLLDDQRVYSTGKITKNSKLILTRDITNADLDASGHFTYKTTTYNLNFARLIDLTTVNGGALQVASIIDNNKTLSANFNRNKPDTRYLLQLYGELPNLSPPDLIVGEIQAASKLLDSNTVYELNTKSSFMLRTPYAIDRIEVVNEQKNMVRSTLVAGEVGGSQVIVTFQADVKLRIHFRINIYGQLVDTDV